MYFLKLILIDLKGQNKLRAPFDLPFCSYGDICVGKRILRCCCSHSIHAAFMLHGNTLAAVGLCIRLASSFLLMSLAEVCIEHEFLLLLALLCYLRVVWLSNYLSKLRALSLLVFHLLEVFVVCRIEYKHILLSHFREGVLWVDD